MVGAPTKDNSVISQSSDSESASAERKYHQKRKTTSHRKKRKHSGKKSGKSGKHYMSSSSSDTSSSSEEFSTFDTSDSSSDSMSDRSQPTLPAYNSHKVALCDRLPKKIQKRIWGNKFVDLDILLAAARKPSALFEKKSSKKGNQATQFPTIKSVTEWVTAFNVFAGVYLMRFPEEGRTTYISVYTCHYGVGTAVGGLAKL